MPKQRIFNTRMARRLQCLFIQYVLSSVKYTGQSIEESLLPRIAIVHADSIDYISNVWSYLLV